MKKIWIFCIFLASLSLVGCFHVPDEDWLLSDNEVETGNVEKTDELEQAVNSFMDGIGLVSSEWNEMKNTENENEFGNGELTETKEIDIEQ